MRRSPAELWSALRSTYWLVPALVTFGGVGLAVILLLADPSLDLDLHTAWRALYPTAAEGARTLLSAIISSMITVVSVTFSVTIVSLTVASQHFGPRVLNSFMRDSAAQAVLGIFIATFVYCVLVLQSVHGSDSEQTVPRLALGGALALVALSVAALIFYVHHVARSLQVSTIAASIAFELEDSLNRVATTRASGQPADGPAPSPPDTARLVQIRARTAGYIQSVDEPRLAALLEAHEAVGWVRRIPGDFVITGAPLVDVSSPSAVDEDLEHHVNALYVMGRDRTAWQDPEFVIKQLVEIALRALSPGVNEPFTAVTCIDRLGQGLALAARTTSVPTSVRGPGGQVRLVVPRQGFETLVRAAFDPIRMFAGHNPAIPARLLNTISALADVVTDAGHRAVLAHQLEVIWRSSRERLTDPDDLAYLEGRYHEARDRFDDSR